MRKITVIAISIVLALFAAPILNPAYATNICPPGYENLCSIDASSIRGFIEILTIIAIILSVFFLIWGGIKWVMSSGDKGKIEQARSAIIASIVGLVISLLAYFIISVVVRIFTGNESMNLPIPTLY